MTAPVDIGIVGTFDVENYGDLLDDVAELLDRNSGARDPAPDRRALAAWALHTARRHVASFESAAVRFRHR